MNVKRNYAGRVVPQRFSLEQIEEAEAFSQGFCVACGTIRDCCEPDARKYHCDDCGLNAVYGAEEILLMGLLKEEA